MQYNAKGRLGGTIDKDLINWFFFVSSMLCCCWQQLQNCCDFYIIGHYKRSARITTYLLIPLMFGVLILYEWRCIELKIDSELQIFEKISMGILFFLKVFARNLLRRIFRINIRFIFRFIEVVQVCCVCVGVRIITNYQTTTTCAICIAFLVLIALSFKRLMIKQSNIKS